LEGFGSEVVEITDAWLKIVPPAVDVVTERAMSGAVPTSRLARVQVTVVDPLQLTSACPPVILRSAGCRSR
jgi:hypothetical protein